MNQTPTAACVLCHHPATGLVLAERHAAGLCLPGGKLRPDEDSLWGAKRELLEETGAELLVASPIITYSVDGYVCEAFFAQRCRYPDSLRPGAAWVDARLLVSSDARFPEFAAGIFAALSQLQTRPSRMELRRCGW